MSNHGIFKAQNIASRNTNNSFVNHGTFDIGTADISGYLENNGTAEFNERLYANTVLLISKVLN